MQLYSKTAVTESGTIRATKSIGALMFSINNVTNLASLASENIKVWVERANGDNFTICPEMPLRDFIANSTWSPDDGNVHTDENDNLVAVCEISEGGAIPLSSNESIKIELSGLVGANTYSVNGIEYPVFAQGIHEFEQKRILTDEKTKTLNVSDWDYMTLQGDVYRDIYFTFNNGERVKYTNKELRALSRDISPISVNDFTNQAIEQYSENQIIFPLTGVELVEIEKITGTLDVLLKRTQY